MPVTVTLQEDEAYFWHTVSVLGHRATYYLLQGCAPKELAFFHRDVPLMAPSPP